MHNVSKGNRSRRVEDELINFNQTSIFKCWKMITNTGNIIKAPAIYSRMAFSSPPPWRTV